MSAETPPDTPSGLPEGYEDEPLGPPDPTSDDAPETGEQAMPGIPDDGEPPASA
jgi:hypothetical protein